MKNFRSEERGVLVLGEQRDGRVTTLTKQLIGEGKRLADQLSSSLHVLLIGENFGNSLEELKKYPIDRIVIYQDKALEIFIEDHYSEILCDAIEKLEPEIVLIGSTIVGKSIAPVAATRFKTGLTADCTSLKIDADGNLIQIRPAYGGNLMAEILTKTSRPQMATIREGVMREHEVLKEERDIKIEFMPLPLFNIQSKILEVRKKKRKEINLDEYSVLIAVGNGFKSREDLKLAYGLAEHLKGEVVSSRVLVEKGWMKYEYQVGFSGKTVAPALLITLGVSGSVQFMAGIKESGYIIAVNNDSEAPIFSIADEGYVGDVHQITEQLIKKIVDGKLEKFN